MKLRIRASGGGSSATFKVEVPAACSLQGLEDAIVEALESRGSHVPRPLRVSLNKKEPLQGHASSLLSQFGICNGDLLFYLEGFDAHAYTNVSLNPGERSISNVNVSHAEQVHRDPLSVLNTGSSVLMASTGTNTVNKDAARERRELCAAAAARRASAIINPQTEGKRVDNGGSASVVDEPGSSSTAVESSADMQIDGGNELHDTQSEPVDTGLERLHNSMPAILQRILNAEHGSVSRPGDFLLLAVHAVMLETGFIVMNPVEEGHTLPGGWCNGGVANISYTLRDMPNAANGVGSVVLKSLTLGGNVVVYGTITGSGLPSRKISLLTSKHIIGNVISHDDPISSFNDVFELWKCAKDELCLPLLTALCEMVGLPAPPSLLVIPTELKMKILECLPALDLVKAGCTCSELRHLCANDDLWKKLFYHDFGNPSAAQQLPSFRGWRSAYAVKFLEKKRMLERRPRVHRPFYGISSRSRFPRIIGGDYDIYPLFGNGPFRGGFGGPRGPLGGLHGRIGHEDLEGTW